MGILKKLPGPHWRGFDAEKVNGSAQAYSILAIPDALLGLTRLRSYGVPRGNGFLRTAGETHPLIPIGMGVKLVADAALAGSLPPMPAGSIGQFSVWSLLTAAATFCRSPARNPRKQKRPFAV